MKFQALGSHYSFDWAMRQLLTIGSNESKDTFIEGLSTHYSGLALTYSKGRHALSEAVRIAILASGKTGVVVNGLTCSVVVDAVRAANGTPVYADVTSPYADFSAETLEKLCEQDDSIGTVIIQNTFGVPCDITSIQAVAKKYNLIMIEDLAHAVGQAYLDEREVGTVGDMTMLSFGRDKLLDVVNGGALIVRNEALRRHVEEPDHLPRTIDQLRDRIYPLLSWCVRRTYGIGIGKALLVAMYKLRLATRSADGGIDHQMTLPNWQAALALKRWHSLDALNDLRRARMATYERYLGDALISSDGTIRAAILRDDRKALLRRLKKSGYELYDTWYDVPIGPKRKFHRYHYPTESCPNATTMANQLINLPTHPEISEQDAIKIAEIVRQA